jgi:hypothetical protein
MPGEPGFDVMSGYEGFNQNDARMFSPVYGRDTSPSLSPVDMRPGGKGPMYTQYGNFLYQVDAKQFPGQRQPAAPIPDDQLALKNQLMHLQAYQANGMNPAINVQQLNPKNIQK